MWGWWPEADVCAFGDHAYMDNSTVAYGHDFSKGHLRFRPISIGAGCELQPLSQVLPGTLLPDGTRVGPKSLVLPLNDVPPCCALAGNPSRRLGRHFVHQLEGDADAAATYEAATPWWRSAYRWVLGRAKLAEKESLLPR
eukprot:6300106-Prymnesium_polylepis.1